jgi:hypothetical protein
MHYVQIWGFILQNLKLGICLMAFECNVTDQSKVCSNKKLPDDEELRMIRR